MKRFRRLYYDLFSGFYDLIIRLHSRDDGASLRDFLVESSGLANGNTHLDICTGTGSVALRASRTVGEESGKVIAVDFSRGMLKKARQKVKDRKLGNVHLVEADVPSQQASPGHLRKNSGRVLQPSSRSAFHRTPFHRPPIEYSIEI